MTPRWLAKLKSLFGITKFQTKTLSVTQVTVGVKSDLTFNNIEAGKAYRVSVQGVTQGGSGEDPSFEIRNTDGNAVFIGSFDWTGTNTLVQYVSGSSKPFIAPVNGTITFYKRNATGDIFNGFTVTLEELPNHAVTTQWT